MRRLSDRQRSRRGILQALWYGPRDGALVRISCPTLILLSVLALPYLPGAVPSVLAQIPDPKQMSGVPLPVGDLPAGTVTVRVVRGTMTNVISGQRADLIGPTPMSANTNDAGRAEFT